MLAHISCPLHQVLFVLLYINVIFSGTTGIVAQIIINANDGTKGVALFANDSAR